MSYLIEYQTFDGSILIASARTIKAAKDLAIHLRPFYTAAVGITDPRGSLVWQKHFLPSHPRLAVGKSA